MKRYSYFLLTAFLSLMVQGVFAQSSQSTYRDDKWYEQVKYLEYTWDEASNKLTKHEEEVEAIDVERSISLWDGYWCGLPNGWYILKSSYFNLKTLVIQGDDVHLILEDGCYWTCSGGVKVETGKKLTIHSQSDGSNQGKLLIYQNKYNFAAAIGSAGGQDFGDVVIHGGYIEATCSSKGGPGIGSGGIDGYQKAVGSVTIYNGTVKAKGADYAAGIGGGAGDGDDANHGCYYTQYGGTVTAEGGCYAAGVGGGGSYSSWKINSSQPGGGNYPIKIYGGSLTAWGGEYGAGIGTGYQAHSKNQGVYIYGGTVKAFGGEKAAGIGGGRSTVGGLVEITGGTVEATAGYKCDATDSKGGSAIGSGEYEKIKDNFSRTVNWLTIGDQMNVTAGSSASSTEGITARDNRVNACHWRNYAKVAVCEEHDQSKLSYTILHDISGASAYHKANCKYCNYEITRGHIYDQDNGNACICGNKSSHSGAISIEKKSFECYYPNPETTEHEYKTDAKLLVLSGIKITPKNPADIDGYIFKGWLMNPPIDPVNFVRLESDELINPGTEVTITQNTKLFARYVPLYQEEWTWAEDYQTATLKVTWADGSAAETFTVGGTDIEVAEGREGYKKMIAHYTVTHNGADIIFSNVADVPLNLTLKDAEANYDQIEEYNGFKLDKVTLSGRTFFKNKTWNTLCLPFALSSFTGTPLEGADVRTLVSSSYDGITNTLTLNFSEEGQTTSIEAGKPYIVRWTADGLTNLQNPEFLNVTISKFSSMVSTDFVDFTGFYDPIQLEANDQTSLYMGSDNKLYWPAASFPVNAFRAAFQLKGALYATYPETVGNAPSLFLDFGNGEVSGIDEALRDEMNASATAAGWYTLDGRKVSDAQPAHTGIYIHNGKKIVIK